MHLTFSEAAVRSRVPLRDWGRAQLPAPGFMPFNSLLSVSPHGSDLAETDNRHPERTGSDPEFIAMMNELEADIDEQRQWYEENKDKPLF